MTDPLVFVLNTIVYVCVLTLNVAAHWFPWPVIPGTSDERGRLRRVLAYAYGVGSIFLGFVVIAWAWVLLGREFASVWAMVRALAGLIWSAGIGTVCAYLIDGLRERQALREDLRDYEQALEG